MRFEVPVCSERFTDMARPSVFGVQLDGSIVQHILYMDNFNPPANPDNAMELTRTKEHTSDCGSFPVDLERMSR